MDIFSDVTNTARTVASTVSKKAQEVIDYSKKKFSCMEVENELDKSYSQLGKYCFDEFQDDIEINDEMKEMISKISKLKIELEEKRAEFNSVNVNVCTECGYENLSDAVFCTKCGHKL